MSTLHDRIRAAVDERLAIARAATPAPWEPDSPFLSDVVSSALLGMVADCSVGTGYRPQSLDDARHIAANDPSDAILSAEHALSVLKRHRPTDRDGFRYGRTCAGCPNSATSFPCIEIRELATRWRAEVDG